MLNDLLTCNAAWSAARKVIKLNYITWLATRQELAAFWHGQSGRHVALNMVFSSKPTWLSRLQLTVDELENLRSRCR